MSEFGSGLFAGLMMGAGIALLAAAAAYRLGRARALRVVCRGPASINGDSRPVARRRTMHGDA